MVNPMAATTRDQQARYDIGALEQRVVGVEKAVGDIAASISALGTKIDERSRTPWMTVIAAFGFILSFFCTVGFLAYRPVEAELQRHDRELNKFSDRLDKYQDRYIQDLKDKIKKLQAK